jgi:hypothetical protein
MVVDPTVQFAELNDVACRTDDAATTRRKTSRRENRCIAASESNAPALYFPSLNLTMRNFMEFVGLQPFNGDFGAEPVIMVLVYGAARKHLSGLGFSPL